MCLSNTGRKLTATKDLVCYKRLVDTIILKEGFEQYHGKEATAIVGGEQLQIVISIHDGRLYLCSNNRCLNGRCCPNKFGLRYSWIVNEKVKSIKCDGEELIAMLAFKTPYQDAVVKIGQTYKSDLRKDEDDKVSIGIHSFLNLEDAKCDGSGTFVECCIPKGARYYKGVYANAKNYASDTLIYVKIIE